MLTLQVESFTELLDELKPLLPLHWEELALNKDKVPLDPQFDVYIRREAAGEVMTITARQDGRLAGYFIGFVAPGLHYKTCLTLIMDIFFIHPDSRNGFAGIKLFKAVEAEARRRGVQRIIVGSKIHADASILFERLSYSPVETYFAKWIGD